jgi:DNA primase large subunit
MSITSKDMAKYPFLPQARKYISRLDIDFNELASYKEIRERAKQRIISSLNPLPKFSQETSRHYEAEIVSYALALLYVSGIGEDKLTQRFALFEAQKINSYLTNEKHVGIIIEIANAFKWNIKDNDDGSYSIHFSKYLQNTSRGRLFQNTKWKLVNRSIENGWVHINPSEMARLLQEEVRSRIEKSAKQEVVNPPAEIQKDIDEIKTEFQKRKPQFEKIHIEVQAKESEYPPCISSLIDRASNGQHLSHVERFTMVTYLLHQGVEIDSIVNLFSKVSDFKEDLTRYQIENLAGQRGGIIKPYVTYNCSTLLTHNVCPLPDDPICNSIRNPLTYHLLKKNIKARKRGRK